MNVSLGHEPGPTIGGVAMVIASTVWMALWDGWRGRSGLVMVPAVVLHAFWRINAIKNFAT